MNNFTELPGVYYQEIDETISPSGATTQEKGGYAGAAEKGYIGMAIDLTSTAELKRLYGEGSDAKFIQPWHAVDHMVQDGIIKFSRAINTGSTFSSYANVSTLNADFVTKLIFAETALIVDTTDDFTFWPDGSIGSSIAVDFVKQELNAEGTLEVYIKHTAYLAAINFTSKLVVDSVEYLAIEHADQETMTTKKVSFVDTFAHVTGDVYYQVVAGGETTPGIGDMSPTELVELDRNTEVNGLVSLWLSHDTVLACTPGTTQVCQFRDSVLVDVFLVTLSVDVEHDSFSQALTFNSTNKYYGDATQVYDILDPLFETRLRANTGQFKDFAIFANSCGVWGNQINVKVYGKDAVEADVNLKKAINFGVLLDHEVLLVISNGSINETFTVTLDESAKDASGQYYYIEDVTRSQSQLITFFANFASKVATNFDYDITLTDGADGTVVAADITKAYKVFANTEYEVPLIITGDGTFVASDIESINQGVNSNVLDKMLDRFGLFNVPLSLIHDADPYDAIETWVDAGSWKISSTYHKYATTNTFFEIANKYGNKNITMPGSVLTFKNYIQTFDAYGRQKAVMGENRGVIGSYKSCVWVAELDEADKLYIRRINPIVKLAKIGLVLNGQKTGLSAQSASNRSNVRLKQNEVEYDIVTIVNAFVAEDTTKTEWDRLYNAVATKLQKRKDNSEINDFEVQCDINNNPPEVQARNEIQVTVGLDYIKTGERIMVTFITKTITS